MNAENATTELCPPNPNELEMAGNREWTTELGYWTGIYWDFKQLERCKPWASLNALVTYQHSLRAAALRLRPCRNQLKALGSTVKWKKIMILFIYTNWCKCCADIKMKQIICGAGNIVLELCMWNDPSELCCLLDIFLWTMARNRLELLNQWIVRICRENWTFLKSETSSFSWPMWTAKLHISISGMVLECSVQKYKIRKWTLTDNSNCDEFYSIFNNCLNETSTSRIVKMENETYKLIYGRMQPSRSNCFHSGNGFQTSSSTKAVPYHRLKVMTSRKSVRKTVYHFKKNTIQCNHVKVGESGEGGKEGEREIALVALILIPDVFLNTFLMALISAKSPARVDVACALM